MKRILYLTFYFEPDLSACSFRNTPLVKELAVQAIDEARIDVFTTMPNRYSSYEAEATNFEKKGNYSLHRIVVPTHNSGMKDQVLSFKTYYDEVRRKVIDTDYDLVVASSSRLFTAYLGYTIAKKKRIPLYLDIRDIFVDTIKDVVKNPLLKIIVLPIIKRIESCTFNYAKHINLISKGFKPYFDKYKHPDYSYFTNGIDPEFIEIYNSQGNGVANDPKKIVYAGNIGEGQGLHRLVPLAAKELGNKYEFHIFGDGGAKQKLIDELKLHKLHNVILSAPLPRHKLMQEYANADYLLVHLNDYDAFKKVLPSKIFELAMFNKTLLAGVSGYARTFIEENLGDSLVFQPCDYKEMVHMIKERERLPKIEINRKEFIADYNRTIINSQMAKSILNSMEKC